MTPRTSPWRYALVVFAIGQLVSPTLLFLTQNDALTADATDTPITPPGWTFLIWGVVCLLGLAYALYQRPGRGGPLSGELDRIAEALTPVFVLYSLWLAVAALDVVAVTVVIFAAMLVGLLRTARVVRSSRQLAQTRGPRLLVGWLLGTYTGWTAVAVFVNLSAAVRQAGAPVSTAVGLAWQAVLLAAAVVVAVAIARRWRAPWPYVLTVLWALTGAAESTYRSGAVALSVEAAAGIAVIAVTTYFVRRDHRRDAPPLRTATPG